MPACLKFGELPSVLSARPNEEKFNLFFVIYLLNLHANEHILVYMYIPYENCLFPHVFFFKFNKWHWREVVCRKIAATKLPKLLVSKRSGFERANEKQWEAWKWILSNWDELPDRTVTQVTHFSKTSLKIYNHCTQ